MLQLLKEVGTERLDRRAELRKQERHDRQVRQLNKERAETAAERSRLAAQRRARRLWGFFLFDG